MKISIPTSITQHCAKKKLTKNVNINTHSYGDSLTIDIEKISKNDLKAILKVCESEDFRPKGKRLAGALRPYLEAMECTDGIIKNRKLRPLTAAIRAYVKTLQPRWFLSVDSKSYAVPYQITDVVYYPPYKDRAGYWHPARIEISGKNIYRGQYQNTTFAIHASDVFGCKTIAEVLVKSENPLITPTQFATYEKEKARYLALRQKTGEQFLAGGKAQTETEDRWAKNTVNMSEDNKRTKVIMDDEFEKEGEALASIPEFVPDQFYLEIIDREGSDEDDEDENEDETADGDLLGNEDDDVPDPDAKKPHVQLPYDMYVRVFSLKDHMFHVMHVSDVEEYKYDTSMYEKLVLPAEHRDLIEMLLLSAQETVEDTIKGKSTGTMILSSGAPGTGKTLTAEIYAECAKRPLYMVQCSQLGITADNLESNLQKILDRGLRWRAVMLIDEADVYIRARDNDVDQNAIVGVFLRLLEYFAGVLFLTTNREDVTDDAIRSRMSAIIRYTAPKTDEERKRLWTVLGKQFGVNWEPGLLKEIIETFPKASGRTIRKLIKLATTVSKFRKNPIDIGMMRWVAQFQDCEDNVRSEFRTLAPSQGPKLDVSKALKPARGPVIES